MNAPVFRVAQRRQHVDVGVLQFREFAPFQNIGADAMLARERLQHFDAGRPPGLIFFAAGDRKLFKEDTPELLRGPDIERFPRRLDDALGDARDARR